MKKLFIFIVFCLLFSLVLSQETPSENPDQTEDNDITPETQQNSDPEQNTDTDNNDNTETGDKDTEQDTNSESTENDSKKETDQNSTDKDSEKDSYSNSTSSDSESDSDSKDSDEESEDEPDCKKFMCGEQFEDCTEHCVQFYCPNFSCMENNDGELFEALYQDNEDCIKIIDFIDDESNEDKLVNVEIVDSGLKCAKHLLENKTNDDKPLLATTFRCQQKCVEQAFELNFDTVSTTSSKIQQLPKQKYPLGAVIAQIYKEAKGRQIKCGKCKIPIFVGELMIGVQMQHFHMIKWRHLKCFCIKQKYFMYDVQKIFGLKDVCEDDQEKIERHFQCKSKSARKQLSKQKLQFLGIDKEDQDMEEYKQNITKKQKKNQQEQVIRRSTRTRKAVFYIVDNDSDSDSY